MADIYVRKIVEIREEIEEFIGMSQLLIQQNDINIHIKGPVISYGSVPISIISSYLNSFRKTMQRIYGIVNNIEIKTKVPSSIAFMTDFRLNAYQPGSINLSLSLPDKQLGFFDDMDIYSTLTMYFNMLMWINNDSHVSSFIEKVEKEKLERLLINILKTLPDDKFISSIEFSSNSIKLNGKIYVNSQSRKNVKEKLITLEKESEDEQFECRGRVRELDLDKLTFVVRDLEDSSIKEIKCYLDDNIVDDIRSYLDSDVLVSGIVKNGKKYAKLLEEI